MGLYKNRIVVKAGTSTLTNELGAPDLRSFDRLACTLADVRNKGYEIILVTSGAIAVGSRKLNLKKRPETLRVKQAAAAVGQCRVMFLYDKFFGDYDTTIAQILLNADDIQQEEKKKNLMNTFNTLLEMGVIPVVNANDSVNYGEIESPERLFGDNDLLSASVAALCRAGSLVLFSDVGGLYEKNPCLFGDAEPIPRIDAVTPEIFRMAEASGSRKGVGGLKTKIEAAAFAAEHGITALLTSGKHPERLYDFLEGKPAGTIFTGKS